MAVYIGIGSNIRPEANVPKAIRLLAIQTRILGVSTVYVTLPIGGGPEQAPFYNCVVEVETAIPPLELKYRILRRIEEDLGRKRTADKFAPRTIDLDLLLYDDLVVHSEDLTLPDPEILDRPFVAVPLLELSPKLKLPGSGLAIKDVAAGMNRGGMEPLASMTKSIKEIVDGYPPRKDRTARARAPR